MKIHLFGVRGSIPTPGPAHVRYGGNTSCVGVGRDDGTIPILLDAGTGSRLVAKTLGDTPFRGSLLLGHLHWDHTYGLPFFNAGDRPDARVDLYMPAQGDPIEILERPMSPPVFPISPTQLRGDWSFTAMKPGEYEIEGHRVLALEIPHKGGRTFGFRIDDGSRSIAYLSDHSPTSEGDGPHGLGEYHDNAVRLADGVDLLIHDSQYTREEFEVRFDWGHCSWEYPIELAREAGAKRIMLFHHDPGHDDDMLDALSNGLPSTAFLAVEGTVIDV
jgi:phosphoribosyl 1,2-cyclic phosphodiesterase